MTIERLKDNINIYDQLRMIMKEDLLGFQSTVEDRNHAL